MTPFRQRMIGDMQLRGPCAKAQETYLRTICQLAECRHKSPMSISDLSGLKHCTSLTRAPPAYQPNKR